MAIDVQTALEKLPKVRGLPIFSSIERILQPATDFIRGNLLVSTASVGAGVTGLIAGAAIVRARRKKAKKKKKAPKRKKIVKRKPRKRKKKTKAEIKRQRLRNLAKARRARKKVSRKRRIIRGPGLGTREIRHSGKSTKGKFKVVSFRDKRTGKMVRFKARK